MSGATVRRTKRLFIVFERVGEVGAAVLFFENLHFAMDDTGVDEV